VGIIIWGLVPSFYLSCFHDTTRNYLQAQGVLYQPLIVESVSVIIQILFTLLFVKHKALGIMGVIWAKNISDGIYALALYLYIIIWQPTK
jgi:Na+-driven multidrug efflux pump